MLKKTVPVAALLALLAPLGLAQTNTPKPAYVAPSDAESFRASIQKLARSGNSADVDKVFPMLIERFAKDPKDAEAALKAMRNDRVALMKRTGHAEDMLKIIVLATNQLKDKYNVGYVYAMKVIVLSEIDKPKDAMEALATGIKRDPAKNMVGDVMKFWPLVIAPEQKREEYLQILQVIAAGSSEPDMLELALQRRIEILNASNRPDLALMDAKSLYNISSMEHTAAAITTLDKQLAISDPAKKELFRNEQTEGGKPLAKGAEAPKSSVVLAIKVDPTPYKKALDTPEEGGIMDVQLHHAAVLLLSDQAAEALKFAKQASDEITDPKDVDRVIGMIARAMKAQDGTVARANAWLDTRPVMKVTALPQDPSKAPNPNALP